MRTRSVAFTLVLAALAASCSLFQTPAENPVAFAVPASGAVVLIPGSLSGEDEAASSSSARSALSDAWVGSTVEAYHAFARGQVRFASQAARFLKTLLSDLEAVEGPRGGKLIGSEVSLTLSGPERKLAWTHLGERNYRLEVWTQDETPEVWAKALELTLAYRQTASGAWAVSGSLMTIPVRAGWDLPPTGEKRPEALRASFDSDRNGETWMRLEVEGYRSFADLEAGALQNTLLEATRNSAGTVSVVSLTRLEGSRHFVWNGYLDSASGADVLNPEAAPVTEYYAFRGQANADNQATVELGFPTESLGTRMARLFTERLNNNYDFNAAADTDSDEGREVLAVLAQFSTAALDLETYDNSPETVAQALEDTQTALADRTDEERLIVDFLVDLFQVQNLSYFQGTSYQGQGEAPEGYPAPATVTSLSPMELASVDTLDLAYEVTANDLEPGF